MSAENAKPIVDLYAAFPSEGAGINTPARLLGALSQHSAIEFGGQPVNRGWSIALTQSAAKSRSDMHQALAQALNLSREITPSTLFASEGIVGAAQLEEVIKDRIKLASEQGKHMPPRDLAQAIAALPKQLIISARENSANALGIVFHMAQEKRGNWTPTRWLPHIPSAFELTETHERIYIDGHDIRQWPLQAVVSSSSSTNPDVSLGLVVSQIRNPQGQPPEKRSQFLHQLRQDGGASIIGTRTAIQLLDFTTPFNPVDDSETMVALNGITAPRIIQPNEMLIGLLARYPESRFRLNPFRFKID